MDCFAPELDAPEPSREDLYEAAVRAVLDLCDRAEAPPLCCDRCDRVDPEAIRDAIRAALGEEEGHNADRAPVSISGPSAASERLSVPELLGGPEQGTGPWEAYGGEPPLVAQMRLDAARRDQRRSN
jgi:hypothetical protein